MRDKLTNHSHSTNLLKGPTIHGHGNLPPHHHKGPGRVGTLIGSNRAAIFDIDGVLADSTRRMDRMRAQQAAGEPVDWEAFHADQHEDPIKPGWTALLRLMSPQVIIILLTNRNERYRTQTESWLHDHGIEFDQLLMRQDVAGSRNSKTIHLEELLKNEAISIEVAIDDDPGHEEIYVTRGIPFVYAYSGYYESGEYVSMSADD